jgi:capsule polysaccharide export protein KpsE/RkpR
MSTLSISLHRPARTWPERLLLLWSHRRLFAIIAPIAFVLSLCFSLIVPKQYKSGASIMPPSNSGGSTAIFAALAGRALGGGTSGLGGLAGSLLGMNNSTALFIQLLRSGTVSGHIVDRFDLQHVYHKRYRSDTAKALAHHVSIEDDKKSGVITITVEDRDPRRARDIAAAYLDELNLLLNRTSTSSAHQERIFVERRLKQARIDLENAQQSLSEFSSTHGTIDLREQARAEVSSAASLQAQILLEESNINALRQIYGDSNIRLRSAEARVASLKARLTQVSGNSNPLPAEGDTSKSDTDNPLAYPPLRQLPRLAVPFADRYREVQIQEKLFELLTEQFEMSRISEARDVPPVSVIDYPGLPERKSFPPRALLTLGLWSVVMIAVSSFLLLRPHWYALSEDDDRRVLALAVLQSLRRRVGAMR